MGDIGSQRSKKAICIQCQLSSNTSRWICKDIFLSSIKDSSSNILTSQQWEWNTIKIEQKNFWRSFECSKGPQQTNDDIHMNQYVSGKRKYSQQMRSQRW